MAYATEAPRFFLLSFCCFSRATEACSIRMASQASGVLGCFRVHWSLDRDSDFTAVLRLLRLIAMAQLIP